MNRCPGPQRPAYTIWFALLLVGGCMLPVKVAELQPIPRALPEAPVYAQIRQLGQEIALGFVRAGGVQRVAFTIDLLNRGKSPATVDIPQSYLRTERVDGSDALFGAALASGEGAIPGHTNRPLTSLTLAAGEGRTIWAAYQPASDGEPRRTLLILPVIGAEPLTIKLSDPAHTPALIHPRSSSTGVSIIAGVRAFGAKGEGTFYPMPFGVSVWHARQNWKFSLSTELVDLYDRSGEPTVHTSARWWSLDVRWQPVTWLVGAYASGHLVSGDLERTRWGDRNVTVAASAGLAFQTLTVRDVPFGFYLGYVRLFDVPVHPHGIAAGIEMPFLF